MKHTNKLITIFIFFLLFTITYGLSPITSFAQAPSQSLKVSPVILTIPLSPAKTISYTITLENVSEAPIPLTASLNDFETTGEEGGYVFEQSQTNPLLSWITLSDKEMILAPKEKKEVIVTVKTPATIPLGGYYGMLFFKSLPQNTGQTTLVTPTIGILLLASLNTPDDNQQKAHIETYNTGWLHEEAALPLLLRVKNTSLHYFTAKPILTLSPIFTFTTNERQPLYLTDKIIFQGKIRRWEETIPLAGLQPNLYKAHLTVSTGNDITVMQDSYFVYLPFAKELAVTLIGIIGLSLLWKRRSIK